MYPSSTHSPKYIMALISSLIHFFHLTHLLQLPDPVNIYIISHITQLFWPSHPISYHRVYPFVCFVFFFISHTCYSSLTHLKSEYSSTSFACYGSHTKSIAVSYFYSLTCFALYNLSINESFFFTSLTCYCPHTKSISVSHFY